MTMVFSLNQAVALAALGQVADAQSIVERARPVLLDAMGADSPIYRQVLEVQRRLDDPRHEGVQRNVRAPAIAMPFFI